MKFKYLYECTDLKVFNRVRTAGSLHGIEILASRKYQIVLSGRLIPIRKLQGIELYVFAKLNIQDFEDAEKWF